MSDSEVGDRLRSLADGGLDVDSASIVNHMPSFRAAAGGAAARAHMIATTLRSTSGARLDFSGDVSGPRGSWPSAVKALRAVYEAASGTCITSAGTALSASELQRVALEATQSGSASSIPQSVVVPAKDVAASEVTTRTRKRTRHSSESGEAPRKRHRKRKNPRSHSQADDSDEAARTRQRSRSRTRLKQQDRANTPWEPEAASAPATAPAPHLSATSPAATTPLPSLPLRRGTEQEVTGWILRVGTVTVANLETWSSAAGGAEQLRSMLDKLADGQLRAAAPLVAGAAWCVAFALALKEWVPPDQFLIVVKGIASSGGNALTAFDQVTVARFFAMYPKAADCAAAWAATPCALGALAATSIALALSKAGDVMPGYWLNEALGWPSSAELIVEGLQRLAKCNHGHPNRGERLLQLHKHLSDKGVALASIAAETQNLAGNSWKSVAAPVQALAPSPAAASPPAATATAAVQPRPGSSLAQSAGAPLTSTGTADATPVAQPASAAKAAPQQRGKKQKFLPADIDTFSDLRSKYQPVDPRVRKQEFAGISANPTPPSPKGTTAFKFTTPTGMNDRAARWHVWEQLSKVGCFVRQYYLGTGFESFGNATAGLGSKGQYVIFTDSHGTVLFMGSGRVHSPSPIGDLIERLGLIFAPYPINDQGDTGLTGASSTTWAPAAPPQSLDFSFGQR